MKTRTRLNTQGFTLIEVLASVVLLSIIILTFSNLLIFSNKTAVSNNEKLVAVHLAKATLERAQFNPLLYITNPQEINYQINPVTFHSGNCPSNNATDCEKQFSVPLNNRVYQVYVTASQQPGEHDLNLTNIVVEVQLPNSKPVISSKVEGYVKHG